MSIDRSAFSVFVDDDGSNTVGTLWNKAAIETALLDPIDDAIDAAAGRVPQTTTSTGTQNNFALTDDAAYLRCNNATLLTLTGLANGVDGQVLDIISVGAGQVDIANQNGSSTDVNRIINTVAGTISLAAGTGFCRLRYDGTTMRWRVLQHEQGAWITPAFSAGDFTASGSMTWTVGAGDVQRYAYHLRGRILSLSVYLTTTTVGGTPNTALKVTIPGGFTAYGFAGGTAYINNNGTPAAGLWIAQSGTTVDCYKIDQSNWAAATNTTHIIMTISFEVT